MNKENIIKARMVKTQTVCFISDCFADDGYGYQYHQSKLKNLYFDDKKPVPSFKANWLVVEQFPKKIQRKILGHCINERYEIKDKEMVSAKLPEIVYEDDEDYFDEDGDFVFYNLYDYKYEMSPETLEDVNIDWEVIIDAPDFKQPPKISFSGIEKNSYSKCKYEINNDSVYHQDFDKMIFPEVLLHEHPCKFSSRQVYDITRDYIINHIDGNVAKITDNYDFCFSVSKIVPKHTPKTISYRNIFANTKKEREKVRTTVKEFEEYPIFEMTSDNDKYKGFTVIDEIFAANETELNNKMNTWLEKLISEINRPICECPYCDGKGFAYDENIKKIDILKE